MARICADGGAVTVPVTMSEVAPIGAGDAPDELMALAASLAWREDELLPAAGPPVSAAVMTILPPAVVPRPLMERPSEDGAVGELHWIKPDSAEGDDRSDPVARWRVTGSPLAIVAAMKLFSGAISKSRDKVSFPAFESTFEDLLMLQHRYPLRLSDAARKVWDEFYRNALVDLRARAADLLAPVAARAGRFKGTLLPFQLEGVAFMAASRKCVLADDMGLGKTVMAFGLLDRINAFPAVVVCQSHVQRHWEGKLPEFMDVVPAGAPQFGDGTPLTWTSLNGATRDDGVPKADIYIVHYLVLWAWADLLRQRGVRTVIFDEVQELRHSGSRKHDACKLLARAAHNAVGLSGTPIYNHGTEIFTVLNTLHRGCLGTNIDFLRTWCGTAGGTAVVAEPAMLGDYLRDRYLMMRRRKADVLTELPDKRRVVEPIDADREGFADLVREAVKLAKDAAHIGNPFDRARMEQEAIRKTRQATGLAKLPAVIAFVRGLMEAGEPTLVFTHHHAVTDGICDALDEFSPARITGEENQSAKADSQARFMAGATNLIVIGLRCATGIDGLQHRARCVVHAELDWSPAIHAQAEDRAHRMGQKNAIIAYYLVTDLGTDPDMMMTNNLKQSQFNGLMHDKAETSEDRADAEAAAKQHMANVLAMLRGVR